MRRALFEEYANPYARLVNAVQNNTPKISSATVPTYLVEACQAALVKNPITRLQLTSWSSFRPPKKATAGAAARERVVSRSLLTQALAVPDPTSVSNNDDLLEATINLIKVEARRIRAGNTAALPPLSVTRVPRDGRVVNVSFRPAAQQGLQAGLTVDAAVEVVDAKSQAVALSVAAFVGCRPATFGTQECTVVYRGIFYPASIADTLENVI